MIMRDHTAKKWQYQAWSELSDSSFYCKYYADINAR